MATAALQSCATCEIHAEAVFRVEGMDCREEVVILERRLKPLTGLEDLSADLIGQRLHVKYDAAKLTTAAMVEAVGHAGMRMWLEHEEPIVQDRSDWRGTLSVVSGVGLVAGAAAAALVGPAVSIPLYLISSVAGAVYPARRAWTAIRSGSLDINVLMVVAVAGALVLGDYLEAASVVFLFAVAQWLEVRTMARARQAISSLMDLSPKDAIVFRDGRQERVPLDVIRVGDTIVIRPGDKIPLDGVVTAGHSDVNEAPMTGESLPVAKASGLEVFAGTINGHGALDVRVERLVKDTRLARVIHLVETAQASRAPLQSFVERFAAKYTPAVVVLAVVVGVVPWLLGVPAPEVWAYRALVLLVIACPCALVVSTPVSFVAALSAAARHGVLVKGGAVLERLAATRIVAFDKTGTLTTGALGVVDVLTVPGVTTEELVRAAASVESRASHPIANAIASYAQSAGIATVPVTAFVSVPGVGVEGVVDGRRVLVGGDRQFERHGTVPVELGDRITQLRARGTSVVLVSVDARVAGALALADEPRPGARDALDLLRAHGVQRTVMLTGDAPDIARTVASQVGVDGFHASLLPADKHELIRTLSVEGPVLMVGDGINDAPALAAAHVGVAMGAIGSDVALEAADVALMSDDLLKLPYMLRLARATVRNVRTNVAISLALKLAFLAMAVAGVATLWMAVLADTGATIIVVANALRLLRQR
ncbi:MAG: cation-translocating P-type ATPase [Vicinamibacterales bacterium]